MRPRLVLAGMACALLASPALAQRPPPDESWGKRGTSYLQYRTDAVECAYKVGQEAPVSLPMVDLVFSMDLPIVDPGGATDTTGALGNSAYDAISSFDSAQARMSRPWREAVRQVRPALARCLTDRGYHRFRMTKDQVEQLKKLPAGSRARNVYLWNLSVASAPR
jgi:hypothetical protein